MKSRQLLGAERIRLTIVVPHPVQYYSPWFRHITACEHAIELQVLYLATLSPEQQGVGFGQAIRWDTPLLEGHRHRVVNHASMEGRGAGDSRRIGDELDATSPEVVLLPGWQSPGLIRAAAHCRAAGIPMLYRGDTNLQTAPRGLRRAAWRWRTAGRLRWFSGYLAVGSRSREYLTSFGIAQERVFDSPHAIDTEYFGAGAAPYLEPALRDERRRELGAERDDEFVVLFVGKFEETKRLDDVIRAVPRLPINARLIAVGSGRHRAASEALAKTAGVRVTWAGFRNQSELPAFYAAADCLVVPGRETWGLVINEAMSCGLPCVASNEVGAAPDMIRSGVTGEVFQCGDVDGCAAALMNVHRTRARVDVGDACRAMAARFSYTHATTGLVDGCRSVLESSRNRRPA